MHPRSPLLLMNADAVLLIVQVAVLQHTLGTPTPVRRVALEGESSPSAAEAVPAAPTFSSSAFQHQQQQQQEGNVRQPLSSTAMKPAPAATPSASTSSAKPPGATKPPLTGAKPSAAGGAAPRETSPARQQPQVADGQPWQRERKPEQGLLQELQEVLGLAWEVRHDRLLLSGQE